MPRRLGRSSEWPKYSGLAFPPSIGMSVPLPQFLERCPEGCRLRLKVQPRGSRNAVDKPVGEELKVWVTAAPVDDAANQAVCRLLAEVLDGPRSAVNLVRGRSGRHKWVQISGLSPDEILARLSSK